MVTAAEKRAAEERAAKEEAARKERERAARRAESEAKVDDGEGTAGTVAARAASRATMADVREQRRLDEEETRREREGLVTDLPPGVKPGESLDPKVNPKVGPQDLSSDDRAKIGKDYGYIDGTRMDQMQGVQSAQWPNDVDEDDMLELNRIDPPNLDNVAEISSMEARKNASASTLDEMDAGARALERAGEAAKRSRERVASRGGSRLAADRAADRASGRVEDRKSA